MKIGDKVRMLRGTEEGRVVNFKEKNIVEIEIEDGFIIPVIKDDLVVVSSEEADYFGNYEPEDNRKPKYEKPVTAKSDKSDGVYLAFLPINENDLSLNLLNLTDSDFLFNFSEAKDNLSKSLQHGTLGAGRDTFITYVQLDKFEKWPSFHIQIIRLFTQMQPGDNFFEYKSQFKAKNFIKSKQHIPSLGKEGYLIKIDEKLTAVDTDKIKESIYQKGKGEYQIEKDDKPYESNPTIDLHIEKLSQDYDFLSNEEMLDIQINKFEKELDKAIIKGCQSIKFIHGVGNGTLRIKIHKILSQSNQIKYFEDSDKGKFGYGATTVHL